MAIKLTVAHTIATNYNEMAEDGAALQVSFDMIKIVEMITLLGLTPSLRAATRWLMVRQN